MQRVAHRKLARTLAPVAFRFLGEKVVTFRWPEVLHRDHQLEGGSSGRNRKAFFRDTPRRFEDECVAWCKDFDGI